MSSLYIFEAKKIFIPKTFIEQRMNIHNHMQFSTFVQKIMDGYKFISYSKNSGLIIALLILKLARMDNWRYVIKLMNFIDHYNTTPTKCEVSSSQSESLLGLISLKTKQSERGLPNYLIYMRSKFDKEYPNTSIAIFSNRSFTKQSEADEELIMSIVHHHIQNRAFQYLNEVIINEKCQSIIIKGSLLSNNQRVKIQTQPQIMMALRKVNNLNSQISPLRLNVDPIEGTVELMNCSYVDSHFNILNNSQKNIEYFTQRVSFIINLILEQINLLFYVIEDQKYAEFYEGKFKENAKKGKDILSCLENSLFRTSIDFNNNLASEFTYKSKKSKMAQVHECFYPEVHGIFEVFNEDVEKTEYLKPKQVEKLASHQYEDAHFIAQYATEFEELIGFSIYTKIRFVNEVKWEDLAQGGFGKIQRGTAQFSLLKEEFLIESTQKRKSKTGETEEEKTTYSTKKYPRQPFVEAIVTRKTEMMQRSTTARMEREKATLKGLKNKNHPNIMTYFESDLPEDKSFLYSLYEENESLDSLLEKNRYMSFFQKILLLEQAAKGLLFLHKSNIVHLDFKPANLIVGKKYLVKICDFGQSYLLNQTTKNHKFGCSFPYSAPEAYALTKIISQKNDIYSLGVTIYKCLFSEHIWGTIVSKVAFLRQLKKDQVIPFLTPEKYGDFSCQRMVRIIVYLCLTCINPKPSVRPSLLWIVTVLEQCRKYLQQIHYK